MSSRVTPYRLRAIALVVVMLLSVVVLSIGSVGVSAAGNTSTIVVAEDGSGDYTKIQDAVEAASPGDTIQVEPGVYPATGSTDSFVTIDTPDLTIRGDPEDSTRGPSTDAPDLDKSSGIAFKLTPDADGTTITGLNMSGAGVSGQIGNHSSRGVELRNVEISQNRLSYVSLELNTLPSEHSSIEHIDITGNVFHDNQSGGDSVHIGGDNYPDRTHAFRDINVSNNEMRDGTSIGSGAGEATVSNITVSDNLMAGLFLGLDGSTSGNPTTVDDVTVEGNSIVYAHEPAAVRLEIPGKFGPTYRNVSVAHNTIELAGDNFANHGIWLSLNNHGNATYDVDIVDNVVNDSFQDGIYVKTWNEDESNNGPSFSANISRNEITNSGDSAIHFLGDKSDGLAAPFEVRLNVFEGNAEGITNNVTGEDVDARNNYWGSSTSSPVRSSDGPSSRSGGPLEDPVTGALANGSGQSVSENVSVSNISNVRFDPFLLKPPAENFEVSLDSTNAPVAEGETLTVDLTVENVGSLEGTQTVSLEEWPDVYDSTSVTLAAGESTTVTLSWATVVGDAGDHSLTALAGDPGDHGDSTTVDVSIQTNSDTGDWPMFRANPRHTGTNNASGVDSPVTEQWRFETFDGDVYSPAIVNGTVYIGSDDDRVYAIDAENGTKQWDYYAGANIRASPAVVNGTVFFGTGDAFSSTGDVVAVDVKNQTELWNYTTGAGVESSPTVVNGTVYIGSRDGSLYALDAQSGKKIWSKTLDSSESVLSSPAVDSGTVYVGSTDGNLYAVDTKTGSQQWSFQTGDSIVYSSPTVVNDTVYVGSKDHNVYAVWATNGTQRWSFATSGDLWSSPAVVNGTVYIGSGVGNSAGDTNLYALDAGSGNKDWEFTTGAGVESSPAVVNGTIYVGSNDKNIYAIDALTGTKEWNQSTQGNAVGLSSPAVVNTTVYIGGDSDFARAFTEESSSNGEEGDDIPAAPHISSPDKAYNSTTDTSITVIYNATGEVGSQSDLGIFIKNDTGDTATQNTSLNNFKDELTFVVPAGSTQGDETLTLYLNETGSNNLATGTTTLSLFFDPTISNATAIDLKDGDGNVSDGDRIEIRVNATDETGIANVLADSTDFGGSLNTQLTAVSGESYTHNATFTVDGSNASFNGEYNISITAFDQDSAFDSSVSTGRSNTTETNQLTLDIPGNFFDVHSKSVRKLEGSGDMSDIGVEVFLTGDLINVKLNNSIGGDELEDEAVTHSTKFQINTTINGTTPRVLLGGGHNLSWTRTQHPNGSWTVSINVSPHEGDYIGGTVPKFDGTVQANISLNETVGLAIDDLQGLSDARKEDLNGSIMGTDAQQFGSPQYDEQNDTVSLLVEAPHYDVNGVNNSGFFDILLTDALLSSWGVNNASDINISAIGSETRPTSSENTSQGIRLFFPVNYSSGDIKLSPDTSGGQEKAVTAAFTLTPDEPLTDEQITFNASGSTATAGIASYEWDFNSDGSIDATGKVVNHTYGAAGTYQVTLTVTDANGTSTQKTTTVNVTQADCFIATAAFGTPSAEEIDLLRDYRDGVLLDHWAGEILVEQYYELSPPVADFVGGTDRRRGVVREAFVRPLVGVVSIGYQMGGRLLWLGLLGILGAGALGARRTNALRDISSGISRPQSPLVIGALGVSLATASLVTGVSIGVSYSTTIGVALTWAAVLLGPTSVVVALGGIVGRPVTRLTRIVLAR